MNDVLAKQTIGEIAYIEPAIRKQLEARQESLKRKLDEVQSALKLLDENPSFEKVHDAINRVQRG